MVTKKNLIENIFTSIIYASVFLVTTHLLNYQTIVWESVPFDLLNGYLMSFCFASFVPFSILSEAVLRKSKLDHSSYKYYCLFEIPFSIQFSFTLSIASSWVSVYNHDPANFDFLKTTLNALITCPIYIILSYLISIGISWFMNKLTDKIFKLN